MVADIQQIRNRINELRKIIRRHNRKYYELDLSEISDYEYDQLMNELKTLEAEYPEFITPDSPTQTVGGKPDPKIGDTIKHDVKMLSIQDVFLLDDVAKFVDDTIKKFPDAEFLVEEKVDGLSAAMRYHEGVLTQVITRGDGNEGEDVTKNARSISNLINRLDNAPPYIELRGEVFITRRNFEQLNQRQRELGLKTFANPRNCASGSLRHLIPEVAASRRLSFVVFDMMKSEGAPQFETHSEFYAFLEENGVDVIHNYRLCRTAEEVIRAVEEIGESRPNLDWDIDGAVIKINRFEQREILGATAKTPRWQIAYKFPPEIKQSIVREIELNVGRTGKITPVAIFAPISLAGTIVSRATLHNKDFIEKLDVRLGSTVEVFKSGEIIPKIKAVVCNPEHSTPYAFTDHCPSCDSKLDMEDWACVNPSCPAQIENRIIYFAGSDAMDIDGLGVGNVRNLLGHGLIHSIADIYKLDRAKLIEVGGFGSKETDNLLAAIEKSKAAPAEKVLTGLGIDGVGPAMAESLLDKAGSIERLASASLDELDQLMGRAVMKYSTVAKKLREYFDHEENRGHSEVEPIKRLCAINGIGAITAQKILDKFDSIEAIEQASLDELNAELSVMKPREIRIIARHIREFFDLAENRQLIEQLRELGLQIGKKTIVEHSARTSAGQTIVFTGTLTIKRTEAAERAAAHGFVVRDSITSKTTYLVVGDKPGSKLTKAQKLGVTILSEAEFTPTS